VAGDFNMTPWTDQLKLFTRATGLGRFNTLIVTWPMRWRNYPVVLVVAIDNVFTSREFAKIAATGGTRQGSDRPVIADLALAPGAPAQE
jgi:endonuclease/exonuclease/phosphatase (EEP) superfamily protein YafD